MIVIQLTGRTVNQYWDEEAQDFAAQATDTTVYVNPDAIEAVHAASGAPDRYTTHVRMISKWVVFVIEAPEEVMARVFEASKNASNQARWDLESAITSAIIDSRS